LAQDLKIIENWFSAAGQFEVGIGSLDEVISMASKVVNFASNGKLGQIKRGIFDHEVLKPEVGMLMYEVLSILLRNVVQHSKVEIGQEVECEHRISPDSRQLVLRNKVIDEDYCKHLVKHANDAIARPFDEWALGTSPGGTGFSRIKKLLKQAGFSSLEFVVNQRQNPNQFEIQMDYKS
jgi:hypothetical protein